MQSLALLKSLSLAFGIAILSSIALSACAPVSSENSSVSSNELAPAPAQVSYTPSQLRMLDFAALPLVNGNLQISDQEWLEVQSLNCVTLRSMPFGADPNSVNLYVPSALSSKLQSESASQSEITLSYVVAASGISGCPESISKWNASTWFRFEVSKLALDPSLAPMDSVEDPVVPSDGYSVMCADGTYSDSGGIQGACSWHGGVWQ